MSDAKKAKGLSFREGWRKPDKGAEPQKPDVWDEIVRMLRRLLKYCLCCITCGCVPVHEERLDGDMYEAELLEEERTAVAKLLHYLESLDTKEPSINEERLRALSILAYSDNVELQRSAALCYAEISEAMKLPVSSRVLEPLVVLLRSRDAQVQKTSSLALSNFALTTPDNYPAIVASGAVGELTYLLGSSSLEVQCNACGCITTLATTDRSRQEILRCQTVGPLLQLTRSRDLRVQRNASGALLNLTHLQCNRNELVTSGALPVLVAALYSPDADVQYYCAAALSNLAVNEKHRAMMVAIGYHDMVRRCIQLLESTKDRVTCQACLALRNLASDADQQLVIVKLECLVPLLKVIQHGRPETVCAATACLRNLSIHKQNEAEIVRLSLPRELARLVHDMSNAQAQKHAAGTIRNLAAGDSIQEVVGSGCVDALLDMVTCSSCDSAVLVEVTAALAVLADHDESRESILAYREGRAFTQLIELACTHSNADTAYNCAGTLGQLAVADLSESLVSANCTGLLTYLSKFLTDSDPSLVHISLWTLLHLLKSESFQRAYQQSDIASLVKTAQKSGQSSTISELAQAVLDRTKS